MLPKAEPGTAFEEVARKVPTIALVESATGVAGVQAVAAVPGVIHLALGSIDLAFDLDVAADDLAGCWRSPFSGDEGLDPQSDAADEESRHAMRPHLKLAVSMTFLQIASALASITALTRKRWLFAGAGIAAGFGVILAVVAWT